MTQTFRSERDSMGEVQVPAEALWGAQTQRAVQNFPVSGLAMPRPFISALGLIKQAAARANEQLRLLEPKVAQAVAAAAAEVAANAHDREFPIDVFQTGSGTSSNMNANEVIAALASRRLGQAVHANDHVNMCQSSNDVIPTAIHVSAALSVRQLLVPALRHLVEVLRGREAEFKDVVKTGRTHLMDAMPVTLAQELSGWRTQIENGLARLAAVEPRLLALAQGGTAVGTGINAHPEFGRRFCAALADLSGAPFVPARNYFEALSAQDTAVELSGQLKVLAVSLM
jgi:fumarate hydratase, class II